MEMLSYYSRFIQHSK